MSEDQVYARKGQLELAIADCNKSIQINPDDVHAFRVRGGAYARRGEYISAIADYSKVIQLTPNDEYIYLARAHAHIQTKIMT